MRTYLCGQWTKVNTIKLSKVFQLPHFTPIKLNFKGSTKTHPHHICNLCLLHSFIQDPVYYVLCNICAFCHHHKLKMTSPHCTAPTPSSEASEARSPLWRRRRWGGWGRWQPSWPSLWWWCLYPLTTPSTPPPWPPQSQNSCFQAATCNSFFTDLIGNCWESSLSKYRSPWWRKPHKSTWLCPQILYDLKKQDKGLIGQFSIMERFSGHKYLEKVPEQSGPLMTCPWGSFLRLSGRFSEHCDQKTCLTANTDNVRRK